ncbi:hypothetical protein AB1285_18405 [Microbacterium sp. NRRL B-14842]|uniref:hypothetical protein n=1 Tax=Microbacterium sp. NRRL B-14842 TaxID=3162881 RepID=UPI003D2A759A
MTTAQVEEIAQMIAWLAGFDGRTLDGVPVRFRIDREHVITHQETWSGTECPVRSSNREWMTSWRGRRRSGGSHGDGTGAG